jgi:glycosyltransferase involved in cell wall biosynthesis
MTKSIKLDFSVIIPVFNRSDELNELLGSLAVQNYVKPFEVIVVDDGSTTPLEEIVNTFKDRLNINYFYKENSGPGLSRNFGMQRASGNYFIIFDSDCLLPESYLQIVDNQLSKNYTDAYGGIDTAHESFTPLQKAINYSMTSFLTTGGLRRGKSTRKFQLRSFNMGLSLKAFEITGGFRDRRIGEDIDLSYRLWGHQLTTQCMEEAVVYHKRRSSLDQFFKQTYAFGNARPGLTKEFPASAKLSYWFPSLFILGILMSAMAGVFGFTQLGMLYGLYLITVFIDAIVQYKSLQVGLLSILTTLTQFMGYGTGFIRGMVGLY